MNHSAAFLGRDYFLRAFLLYYFFKTEGCTENVLMLYKKILIFLQILFKYHFANTARSIYTLISTLIFLIREKKKKSTKTKPHKTTTNSNKNPAIEKFY